MSRRSNWLKKQLSLDTDEPASGGLRSRSIEVTDLDGGRKAARLMRCPCGGEKFLIYFVGAHQHAQCTACGECYCDGTCGGSPADQPGE
jgi:hypothetical protein